MVKYFTNKFDSLKQLINSLNKLFQIIGLTETWFNEMNEYLFKLENYNIVNVNRSSKSGGGVGIYVTSGLKYEIRTDLNTSIKNVTESVFIEVITTVDKNIIAGIIYKENKLCYLMGDFNIDLLKSESCDYTIRFLEQSLTSSYFPLIQEQK